MPTAHARVRRLVYWRRWRPRSARLGGGRRPDWTMHALPKSGALGRRASDPFIIARLSRPIVLPARYRRCQACRAATSISRAMGALLQRVQLCSATSHRPGAESSSVRNGSEQSRLASPQIVLVACVRAPAFHVVVFRAPVFLTMSRLDCCETCDWSGARSTCNVFSPAIMSFLAEAADFGCLHFEGQGHQYRTTPSSS